MKNYVHLKVIPKVTNNQKNFCCDSYSNKNEMAQKKKNWKISTSQHNLVSVVSIVGYLSTGQTQVLKMHGIKVQLAIAWDWIKN